MLTQAALHLALSTGSLAAGVGQRCCAQAAWLQGRLCGGAAVHRQSDDRSQSWLQCLHISTVWRQRRAVLCFAVQFAAPQLPLGDADFSDLMVGEDPATRKAALTAQLANLKEVRPSQAACMCTGSS